MPTSRTVPEGIARAALEILGETGPADLTMRAVGGRLGVSPRALYNYVADRRDLLGEIVAVCQNDRPQPRLDTGPGRSPSSTSPGSRRSGTPGTTGHRPVPTRPHGPACHRTRQPGNTRTCVASQPHPPSSPRTSCSKRY
ncbi:TetR/AcrR family transcriptional regulator [Streptomyces cyaneofuscatus]|uniref:TetR/AcrR family transcriptional regulator n=1 Tax=Streptomyces cyaneofuscatus TaxID=66883 RepID=UPI0036CA2C40